MIKVKDCVVWLSDDDSEVCVLAKGVDGRARRPQRFNRDPVGANYAMWALASDSERVRAMLELAVSLMVNGYDPAMVVREFSKVEEFHALGLMRKHDLTPA